MWMQACSYLCGAFREINIWEHSVKWSSLNKSPWHNKHFWHMSPPPHPPTHPPSPGAEPPHAHTHKHAHTRRRTHTLHSDTTYLSPPLLVLPNGASPQASKSNPSTNTVGIYLEWAFVLFNVWLLGPTRTHDKFWAGCFRAIALCCRAPRPPTLGETRCLKTPLPFCTGFFIGEI